MAAHLVAAGTLADEDPDTAWWHARAARARGGRIAVVRETVGLVAYRAGEWAEAIGELRAARRMGGGPGHLAVLADCERALGHPEKAIELSRSAQAAELDEDAALELATVVAGARADLGQIDAALAHLEQFGTDRIGRHPRLAYAYADLLDRAGRQPEALTWFIRAANADLDEDTDALERVEVLAASLGAQSAGPEIADADDAGAVDDTGAADDAGAVDDAAAADQAADTTTAVATPVPGSDREPADRSDEPADRSDEPAAPPHAPPGPQDESVVPIEPASTPQSPDTTERADPGPTAENDTAEDTAANDGADNHSADNQSADNQSADNDTATVLFSDDAQAGDR